MRYAGGEYLHLGEVVDREGHVLCRYRVDSSLPLEAAANAIAAEQSTGTWTNISTTDEHIIRSYGGRVVQLTKGRGKGKGVIDVAFPVEDFSLEVGGIPQILSVIAGNLYGLSELNRVRLEDVFFPRCIVRQFKGPRFGVEGLRGRLGLASGRPLVGTIVKPKIGLSPESFASYIYEGGMGGLTNSKDDETLSDQKFCRMEARTVAVAEAIDRVRQETGRRMMHCINVTTRLDRLLETAERVQGLGANHLMVDFITTGFSSVQALAEDQSIKVPIHVHRTMHGAFTRDPAHGVAMVVMAKLLRLSGADGLHIGTFGVGKMHGTPEEDIASRDALLCEMGGLRRTMPVASGGMYPGIVPALLKISGTDVQVQAGGGVSGHPKGVRGGAKAMVQAIDSFIEGKDVKEYAKGHEELGLAIEKWGVG
jgi:ribulose-bisphosphate carboxylase large chain